MTTNILSSTMDKSHIKVEINDSYDEYSKELEIAVKVVHVACLLGHRLQNIDTSFDRSIIQATVTWILHEAFGPENTNIIAEENNLKEISISETIIKAVNECLSANAPLLGLTAPQEPLCARQLTNTKSNNKLTKSSSRFWALGTGGKNVISLALIDNGTPVIGVLGMTSPENREEVHLRDSLVKPGGCVVYARRGGGAAWAHPLHWNTINNSSKEVKLMTSSCVDYDVDPVLVAHVRDETMMECYAVLLAQALGSAEQAASMFVKFSREERVWDHAAGVVIVEEGGGVVSDVGGESLDFSKGVWLDGVDRGVVVSCGAKVHESIINGIDASWCSSCL